MSVWKDPELVRTFLTGVRGALPYAAEQLEIMNRVIGATGRPIERVLDLGSGSGVLARSVQNHFPGVSLVLADFSAPMLQAAASDFASPPHYLLTLDFSDPGWVDSVTDLAPFDAIVSGYAIHHQPDEIKRRIYSEVFGLLAPGAVFAHIEHVQSATTWIEQLANENLVDHLYAFDLANAGGRTREQVAAEFVYRPDKSANILAPLETQLEWMREIGFQDVDCLFKIFELALFVGRRPT